MSCKSIHTHKQNPCTHTQTHTQSDSKAEVFVFSFCQQLRKPTVTSGEKQQRSSVSQIFCSADTLHRERERFHPPQSFSIVVHFLLNPYFFFIVVHFLLNLSIFSTAAKAKKTCKEMRGRCDPQTILFSPPLITPPWLQSDESTLFVFCQVCLSHACTP